MIVVHVGIVLSVHVKLFNTIQVYSGITSGRVLDGEFLYTKIFVYRGQHPVE